MDVDDDITASSEAFEEFLRSLHPAWHRDAACLEHPELDWFPRQGYDGEAERAVCGSCLVHDECLADALEHGDRFGIWGGLGERQRRQVRRDESVERPAA